MGRIATARRRKPSDAYCRQAWEGVCRSQAVIEFAPGGEVTWANDGFLKLIGYDRDRLVGQHHRLLCSADYAASAEYRAFWDRLRDGRYERGIFPRVRSDGRAVWLQATYTPVLREGALHRIVKISSDVTRQVLMELDIAAREEELRATVADLSEVVRTIGGITRQTRHLALNAAIEAARAGEAGAPFGAVAGEVSRLAGDVHQATEAAAAMARRHEGDGRGRAPPPPPAVVQEPSGPSPSPSPASPRGT